jgi:hypothetical protein
MSVKIDINVDSFCIFFSFSLEVGDDSFELRKEMIAICLLIDVPMPIEVIPLDSSSVISQDNTIDIDHGYQYPSKIIISLKQSIDKTLHHPRSDTLPGVLSRHSDNQNLGINVLIYQKSLDFIAENGSGNFHPCEMQTFVHFAKPAIGVWRLAAKLDLIIGYLKAIFKSELKLFQICVF